jgi:hypothetical protein
VQSNPAPVSNQPAHRRQARRSRSSNLREVLTPAGPAELPKPRRFNALLADEPDWFLLHLGSRRSLRSPLARARDDHHGRDREVSDHLGRSVRRVKLPGIERNEMRFFDPEQVARLASTMDERYAAMVSSTPTAAYDFARFRLCAGTASICCTAASRWQGADRGQRPSSCGPPKARAGHRTLPIPRPASKAARTGHASVVTVPDRYGHLLPGDERADDAMASAVPTRAVVRLA